jgi:hypothetical protein
MPMDGQYVARGQESEATISRMQLSGFMFLTPTVGALGEP